MDMKDGQRILYCDCTDGATLSPQAKSDVRLALAASGRRHDLVRDLCALAANGDPLLAELADAPHVTIAACHPRAVKWLFAAAGASLRSEGVTYVDMREDVAADALQSLRTTTAACALTETRPASDIALSHLPDVHAAASADATPGAPAWNAWFPVIDYDRCEDCHQCLGFCLFGVYGAAPDGTIRVAHPAKCKTGCPACARMCPSAAIIFPKYANAPINGAEVKDGAPVAEPVRVDKVALLRGDVLKMLQDRGKGAHPSAGEMDQVRAVQERMLRLAGQQDGLPLSFGRAKPDPSSEKPA
jgi:NAD-dependent dihydropyrimidine dehydrogenase PreA subunit